MRLLLDENLPKRLKQDFPEHIVATVRDMGWAGIKNGALLALMIEASFDALLTFDKNLSHQQNFSKYTIAVIVLIAPINQYEVLTGLSEKVKAQLSAESLPTGPIVISAD